MDVTTGTLRVPGATLHHEVRGSGPVLVLVCGGVYDAAGYHALATGLADRWTVVTYDRRGNSRSPLDGPDTPIGVDEQVADAVAVLTAAGATGSAPAAVFGNSSGGIVGLALAAAHPGLVSTVVAHEPPAFEILDAAHWRQVVREVGEAYRAGGAGAAMEVLGAAVGGGQEKQVPGEPGPEVRAMWGRMGANVDHFAGREVPTFGAWRPDLDALRALGDRVVLGVGATSGSEAPHRATRALAGELGTEPVVFPGGHGGFGLPTFGATLAEVLPPAGP